MNFKVLTLLVAASAAAASAQTPAQPAAPSAAAHTATAPAVTSAKPVAPDATKPAAPAAEVKPEEPPVPNVPPPAVDAPKQTAFCLQYQDISVGTGAVAEPGKWYKVNYTGWRAADGIKFDSNADHPGQPMKDKDGQPVKDKDGKQVLGPPEPMGFPQGQGRLIPGFDQGFAGMHIGGKRRLLIPWQMAYGTREIPSHGGKAGIPAKSDLIFDVELVDVTEPPARPAVHPNPPNGAPHPMPNGQPGQPPAPAKPVAPDAKAPAAPEAKAPAATTAAPAATPAPTPAATPAK